MALTEAEKAAARTATYFDNEWGVVGKLGDGWHL